MRRGTHTISHKAWAIDTRAEQGLLRLGDEWWKDVETAAAKAEITTAFLDALSGHRVAAFASSAKAWTVIKHPKFQERYPKARAVVIRATYEISRGESGR